MAENPSVGKIHPEQREGEIFLGNLDRSWISCLKWKTIRAGKKAGWARRVYGFAHIYPVFVQRQELEELGIDPDKITPL